MVTRHNSASIPLLSLDAIAFDSETSGLDISKAHMIQLGAVRIVHGKVDETQNSRQLINPGVPLTVGDYLGSKRLGQDEFKV